MNSMARRISAICGSDSGGLAIAGRVAGDDQQGVAVAHRHVQHPGQQGDQFAAGPGLAGFHIAEVAGRDPGLQRQVHLAHPASARHWRSRSPRGCSPAELGRGGDGADGGEVIVFMTRH
jgi:hypothetical protein